MPPPSTSANRAPLDPVIGALLLAAAGLPVLLAYNTSPSTTFFNQALAIGLWGAVACCVGGLAGRDVHHGPGAIGAGAGVVRAALAGVVVGALLPASAWWPAPSLAVGTIGVCAVAAVVTLAGGRLAAGTGRAAVGRALFLAWVLAGLASAAVALIQVFAPTWPDGSWIAHSASPGRAVGNLRQPNHLSSVLLWSAIALVGWAELRRLAPPGGGDAGPFGGRAGLLLQVGLWSCLTLFMWTIVLTASRTGLVGVGLLALWGLADRRLSRTSRWLLLAAPLLYAAAWWGMAAWAEAAAQTFGGQQRLAEGDISGSRFRIWADALQLIAAHPWAGVGWGNFNFAWSLAPFPGRHTAFFDHTHNLPLQLAVELGVPMALLICGLLLWSLGQAWRRALAAAPAESAAGRCAVMIVVLIGLHSLLEYPLWYAYFLLPTAFAWGFALGLPPAQAEPASDQTRRAQASGMPDPADPGGLDGPTGGLPGSSADPAGREGGADSPAAHLPEGRKAPSGGLRPWLPAAAGALCVTGAVFSVVDYLRVADIFEARTGAAPLEQRIEAGKRSLFFAHHAHYAAATVSDTPGQEMASFDIASHHLLDTRLMMAWAKGFAEVGDLERARHLAERLREFRNPASAEFFAECDKARSEGLAPSAWPFQCAPPARTLTWQDFLPARVSAQSVQEGR